MVTNAGAPYIQHTHALFLALAVCLIEPGPLHLPALSH
jgi:hypothetical protein